MANTEALIAGVCALGLTATPVLGLTLAEDGRTSYRIVVADDAIAPERHAAEELARFLHEATGAEFPVVSPSEAGDGPAILVGQGEHVRRVAADLDLEGLGAENLAIEAREANLILVGGRPRGTLYAVYDFLEDVVGCRWWSSEVSTVPRLGRLVVPRLSVREAPAMEYREPFWSDARDPHWAVQNRTNGHAQRLDEARGGKHIYKGFVHTFYQLVPPQEYFGDHPEWYSEIDGERRWERAQLCVTNEELVAFVIGRVKAWLRESPEATIVSVSQNDWAGRCLCADCAALEGQEGSPSGPMLQFVNKVAAALEEEFPQVAVSTLAYQYTRKPPLHVKPRPNVIVRLCSIECAFGQPLDSEQNRAFADDIRGWARICQRLYVWNYVTNFSHYICPHPNLRVHGPNIRFFAQNGVKGLFEQGLHGASSRGFEFAELRAWLEARLMWDPDQDDQALIDEFLGGYYGRAAEPIRQYIDLMHDACEESGHYLACFSPNTAPFLNLETLTEAGRLFDEAEAAVADEPEVLDRVRLARQPIEYVWVTRYHELSQRAKWLGVEWTGPEDYGRAVRRLASFLTDHDVALVNWHTTVDEFAAKLTSVDRKESRPPPGCEDLPLTEYVDLQDHGFALGSRDEWAKLAQDDAASDGVAARMPGAHREWACQQWLHIPPDSEGAASEWVCYAVVRCEATGTEGNAFSLGVYDTVGKRGLGSKTVPLSEIEDDGYHVYEIAATKLAEGAYMWVAPPENPDNVEAVWVDRFFLRRAR